MSKRQQSGQEDIALSPYLSFRQALRPAVFAHSILLREKDRAGALVEEANRILTATRELLNKAGLGYIVDCEARTPTGTTGGLGSQTSFLDAFADAAMLWAKIVGSCLVLAESLLTQGRFEEVRRLAAILDDAGEPGSARELTQRLKLATLAKSRERLNAIHVKMAPEEIQSALEALIGVLQDVPDSKERNEWLHSYIPALAISTKKYAPAYHAYFSFTDLPLDGIVKYSKPGHVGEAIYFIAAAFSTRKGGSSA